jgi:3-oxoacyl-[acyl-carrier-protein] synthase-3
MIAEGGHYMQLRGREVYKFAVHKFEELIRDGMRACELTKEQVKLVVPHQVNQRIIDSALEKLEMPPEQAYVNIDRYGKHVGRQHPDRARRGVARRADRAGRRGHLRRLRRGPDVGERGREGVGEK